MENRCASQFIELGRLDEIPPGQGRCVSADGRAIAVFRLRDGRVFALDNHCPHRNGPLSEGVVGIDARSGEPAVICPFHAYKFALADGCGLDSDQRVRSYSVTVGDNGRIAVAIA